MRVYVWNAKLEWMCEDPTLIDQSKELVEQVLSEIRPYAVDVMGMYAHRYAVMRKAILYHKEVQGGETVMENCRYNMQANQEPEKMAKAWNGANVFDIPQSLQSASFVQYQMQHNILTAILGTSANSQKYLANRRVEIQNELKQMMPYDKLAQKFKSTELKDNLAGLVEISNMTNTFISLRRFKQLNHLLAIAMYRLVKIRRELNYEDKRKLNGLQAGLSSVYAMYGFTIASGTFAKLQKHHNFKPPQNEDFTELTELIEDGMEVYTSQFPIVYPDTYLGARKVLQRAIKWNERARQLVIKPEDKRVCESESQALQHLLTTLDGVIQTDYT